MLLQLNPPIPLYVVGRGKGLAHVVIDYGIDFDLHFVVILDDGGEVWTKSNRDVRGVANETLSRTIDASVPLGANELPWPKTR